MKQCTLQSDFKLSGVGLHTGEECTIHVKPAPSNHGYQFIRVDLEGAPDLFADPNAVVSTNRGTSLKKDEMEVHTVEHILSALFGSGIDNAIIELEGPEVPILDGSAEAFVKEIKQAGIEEQKEDREVFVIEEPIKYHDALTGAELLALPSEEFEITTLIDFNSDVIGAQFAQLTNLELYQEEIAPSRTFVFVRELEQLMDMGLIKGGSLENAVVIADQSIQASTLEKLAERLESNDVTLSDSGVLNTNDLRFVNEPARHKLLDVLGDLALFGKHIKGKIIAKKPGHKANVEFAKLVKKKFVEQRKLRGMPTYDPRQTPVYDAVRITQTLPHRFPFVLVDKIIEITDQYVVGVKNVSADEYFFQGHFPNNPIFPGVLQLEAMAQTGGILALSTVEDPHNWDTYFLKIDKVKFKHKVVPGDTLILKLELLGPIRRGICHMQGTAYVGDRLVSEGELTAQIVKRK